MENKENLPAIDRFEAMMIIMSYCMKKWRTSNEIIEYTGYTKRTVQRYVKNLIDYGYMQRSGYSIGSTSKALKMLTHGTFS